MAEAYPFYDRRFHTPPSLLSDTARSEIMAAKGPTIEIGGPTNRGFRLLRQEAILPGELVITNVSGFFGDPDSIDRAVDGKAMPFADKSIGMFLASHLAYVDGLRKLACIDDNDHEGAAAFDRSAIEEYSICLADPARPATHNLRIGVLQEMTRTLRPNGLILFEGVREKDITIAQALGHTTIQQVPQPGKTDIYDCLFKNSTS